MVCVVLRMIARASDPGYCGYLQEEITEEAYWQGRGAQLLEIEWQRVRVAEFNQLQAMIHPVTCEELKPRNGQTVAFYDATVHSPKSASLLGVVDERLLMAHRVAISHLMTELERQSAVRFYDGNRQSGNLIMAAFEHRQSRALDIQTHTHVVIMNLSYDAASGSWKALRSQPLFYNRHELTESYRTALGSRIADFGYQVVDKQRVGFEIEGIPKEMLDLYSRRSIQIQERLRQSEPGDRVTVDNVARWTREGPKVVIPPDQFRQQQLERLSPSERITLQRVAERAYEYSEKMRIRMDIGYGEEPGSVNRNLNYGERIGL